MQQGGKLHSFRLGRTLRGGSTGAALHHRTENLAHSLLGGFPHAVHCTGHFPRRGAAGKWHVTHTSPHHSFLDPTPKLSKPNFAALISFLFSGPRSPAFRFSSHSFPPVPSPLLVSMSLFFYPFLTFISPASLLFFLERLSLIAQLFISHFHVLCVRCLGVIREPM